MLQRAIRKALSRPAYLTELSRRNQGYRPGRNRYHYIGTRALQHVLCLQAVIICFFGNQEFLDDNTRIQAVANLQGIFREMRHK